MGVPWQSAQQVEVDRVLWEALCSQDAGHNINNNNNRGSNNNGGDRVEDEGREEDGNNNNNNNNNLLNELVMITTKCHPISLIFYGSLRESTFLTNQ